MIETAPSTEGVSSGDARCVIPRFRATEERTSPALSFTPSICDEAMTSFETASTSSCEFASNPSESMRVRKDPCKKRTPESRGVTTFSSQLKSVQFCPSYMYMRRFYRAMRRIAIYSPQNMRRLSSYSPHYRKSEFPVTENPNFSLPIFRPDVPLRLEHERAAREPAAKAHTHNLVARLDASGLVRIM